MSVHLQRSKISVRHLLGMKVLSFLLTWLFLYFALVFPYAPSHVPAAQSQVLLACNFSLLAGLEAILSASGNILK